MATQLVVFEALRYSQLNAVEYEKALLQYVMGHIKGNHQPGAGELLNELEREFGWKARLFFKKVITSLRDSKNTTRFEKEYFQVTLNDHEIDSALRGTARVNQEYKSSFEELFCRSSEYRRSGDFREFVDFIAKFRNYSPFNNFLVKVQNPACSFYATERDWWDRFQRRIKEDARPMLILAPMHPVMLVYDLDSTEGEDLPKRLLDFVKVEGELDKKVYETTLHNAERDLIQVQFKELSSTLAGFATIRLRDHKYKMRIVIESSMDMKQRYSILCHELAHIYLGHLGSDEDNWWVSRFSLDHRTVEIEAESTSYITLSRYGLSPSSASYLASYIGGSHVPRSVSLELISKVAGKLEEMGKRKFPPRR